MCSLLLDIDLGQREALLNDHNEHSSLAIGLLEPLSLTLSHELYIQIEMQLLQ